MRKELLIELRGKQQKEALKKAFNELLFAESCAILDNSLALDERINSAITLVWGLSEEKKI